MKQIRKYCLVFMLILVMVALCSCHANPSQDQLYSKLFAHFEKHGFTCQLIPVEEEQQVPVYKASVWQKLLLNGEEVLVYFDDSNRADYLSAFVDEEKFGSAHRFGLRFVLVYSGSDPAVLKALNSIENE